MVAKSLKNIKGGLEHHTIPGWKIAFFNQLQEKTHYCLCYWHCY